MNLDTIDVAPDPVPTTSMAGAWTFLALMAGLPFVIVLSHSSASYVDGQRVAHAYRDYLAIIAAVCLGAATLWGVRGVARAHRTQRTAPLIWAAACALFAVLHLLRGLGLLGAGAG